MRPTPRGRAGFCSIYLPLFALHTYRVGCAFRSARNAVIEASNSRTELKLPSRRYTVMSRKKRSTMFVHELEVGVQCMWTREQPCAANKITRARRPSRWWMVADLTRWLSSTNSSGVRVMPWRVLADCTNIASQEDILFLRLHTSRLL